MNPQNDPYQPQNSYNPNQENDGQPELEESQDGFVEFSPPFQPQDFAQQQIAPIIEPEIQQPMQIDQQTQPPQQAAQADQYFQPNQPEAFLSDQQPQLSMPQQNFTQQKITQQSPDKEPMPAEQYIQPDQQTQPPLQPVQADQYFQPNHPQQNFQSDMYVNQPETFQPQATIAQTDVYSPQQYNQTPVQNQPPMPHQPQPNMNSNFEQQQPSPFDQNVATQPASNKLGIIALILSILTGIIGSIVGVLSIVSGVKSKNRNLIILGSASVFNGIVISVLSFTFVLSNFGSSNLSKLEQKNITSGEVKVSLDVPSKMKEISKTSSSVIYGIEANKKDTYSSQIALGVRENSFSATDFDAFKSELESGGQSNQNLIDVLKSTVKSSLESKVCKDASIGELQNATIKSGADSVYKLDFSCKSDDNYEFNGIFLIVIASNKQDEVDILMAAQDSIWEKNKKTWDKIISGISLN